MKNTWFIKGIIAVVLSLFSVVAQADQVEIAGIYYNLDRASKFARVTYPPLYKYSGEIVIPEHITIDGEQYPVISIGQSAFENSSLTSITIPNSVTSIGASAFKFCHNLTSINIPNSVMGIGEYAFFDCDSLSSITLPNKLETIRNNCFFSCNNLVTVIIPNSVTKIENYALYGCSSLTDVFCYAENCPETRNDSFSFSSNPTLHVLGEYEVKHYKKQYGWKNFKNIVAIEGNYTINGINYYINPYYNHPMATVIRSDSTLYSGDIIIPETTEYGGLSYNVWQIGEDAFRDCSTLSSIVLPNSITSICDRAFAACSGLTSFTIPDNVSFLGEDLFYGCTSLSSIALPHNMETIPYALFRGCEGLSSISIPDSVRTIDRYAFEWCSNLTSINIPNSVDFIGAYAFLGCTSLKSFTIPENVTNIANYTFSGCIGLTDITIPKSVTSIGDFAFSQCSGLTSITIPNSINSIGKYVFSDCSGLTSINIPNSITSIGDHTFTNCCSLTSIIIPNSITSIGDYTFCGCTGLTSVTIPISVTSIGVCTFVDCGLLSVTSLNPDPPTIQKSSFSNQTKQTATLYVPLECKTAYWQAPYWGDFFSIQEFEANDIDKVVCYETNNRQEKQSVCSLSGQLVKIIDANQQQQLNEILPAGIYIVGGKIVIVK